MMMMIRSSGLLLLMVNNVSCGGVFSDNANLPNSAFPGDGGAGADEAGGTDGADMLGAGGGGAGKDNGNGNGNGGDDGGLGVGFDDGEGGDEGLDGTFDGGNGGNGGNGDFGGADMPGGDGFQGGAGDDVDLNEGEDNGFDEGPDGAFDDDLGEGDDDDNGFDYDLGGDFDLPTMLQLIFGECLTNIDVEKISEDPFTDVANQCNEQQSKTFNTALDNFELCAGFDLKKLIENFASSSFGVAMNCGSYFSDARDEIKGIKLGLEDMEKVKAKDSPLPRVPQGCVNALVGNNPFGRAFLYAEEYPAREQMCFSELAGKLPKCTLDEWPVPIVGNWLSAAACIYGGAQDTILPMMQGAMKSELGTLVGCIPEKISRSNCKEIRTKCLSGDGTTPALSMALPPPFWNPPMAQTCKDIADDSGMGDVVDKYEAFRQACIPAADLSIWDIAASHAENNAGNVGGGASYMKAAASYTDGSSTSTGNLSTSTVFVAGLFAGLVVAFAAMFGYYKKKIRDGGRRHRVDQDDFNSLELGARNNYSFT